MFWGAGCAENAGESLEGSTQNAVVLFPEEYLSLRTMESEYEYDRFASDIRAGHVDHILEGTVTMEDYVTAELPDSLVMGGNGIWLIPRRWEAPLTTICT